MKNERDMYHFTCLNCHNEISTTDIKSMEKRLCVSCEIILRTTYER